MNSPQHPGQSNFPAADQHLRAWMHTGLHDLRPGSTLLAIGCDEAFFAPQLAEYATEVTVLDTSAGQMAQLARRFPAIAFLRHNPSHALPFGAEMFNAIWCCEFLDRVFDPATALREMHRVLASGGRLMVTVPDHGGGPLRPVCAPFFQSDEALVHERPRIRQFDRSDLVKLARQAGFADVHTATSGRGPRTGGPRSLLLRASKVSAAKVDSDSIEASRASAGAAGAATATDDLVPAGVLRAA